MKAVLVTALLHLPIALILGGLVFILARWGLRQHTFCSFIKAALLVCALVFAAGTLYGILRFGGLVIFPDDNFNSYNWFDSSYRDNGFEYIRNCGSMLVGIAAAFLLRGKGVAS